MSEHSIALVGAGQASAVAARTLRRRGYDGAITLVGDEAHRPYQRPPLSKEYLLDGDDSALDLLDESWTETHDVRVLTGASVVRVRSGERAVELADGSRLVADQVLLATGGRPRRFGDADGDRICYLRTKADSDRLRELLVPGARVVVVGAGFIGAEVASSARQRGAEVVLLETAQVPLAHALGDEMGAVCARLHHAAGVDLRIGVCVESVEQQGDRVRVCTDDGVRTEADAVVVAIGVTPNDEVAAASGIATHNGILVDEHGCTSQPNVYAAGDVANHFHPLFGTRMRVEHFDNANRQASSSANNMLGRSTTYDDPHWFWSDQYESNLQFVGHLPTRHDLVLRGDPNGDELAAFYLTDGLVEAAFALNRPEDVMVAKELIAARHPVDTIVLKDLDTDLMELLEQL